MLCKTRVLLIVSLVAACWPATVRAQFGGNFAALAAMREGGRPSLSATGAVTLQRTPARMRMYIQIFGKGKNLEEALAKLKERREAAVLQLESLKADKKSIVFDGPTKSAAESAQRRQIEAMVMEQMRSRGKKAKGLQVPQTVTVNGSLTAEWPLEAKSQEQLLILAQGIEDKIKAADLSGSQETQKLSPEEEELAEEAKQAMSRYGETPQPMGQPTFVFVATVSKQDRQKAMADAFKKASAEAAELAKAGGVGLGPLVGLSGGCQGQRGIGDEQYSPYYNSNRLPAELRRLVENSDDDASDKPIEAFSTNPSSLTFTCSVIVTYAILTPK